MKVVAIQSHRSLPVYSFLTKPSSDRTSNACETLLELNENVTGSFET